MSQLQLTCLGDFRVLLAGTPLTAFQTDKMRALLVYLALERQPHERSELTNFLWPGYAQDSARNSFRQYLYQLRQLLRDGESDPPWLLVTRQTVQFNPAAPLQLDVAHFVGLLAETAAHGHAYLHTCQPCLARLRAAVDLYQGDFLAGFTVADSDPFEEWRRIRQEQLHLHALSAFTQLADAAEAAGDGEQALQFTHRQLALEPWLEAAHRRIMRILARRGQRAAAIAQYHRCRQVLAAELETEPEQETTALYEQIQRGAFDKVTGDNSNVTLSPCHLVTLSPQHNLPAALTPFVGRTRELAAVLSRLQTVRLLTLVGAGGMGKTRLAVEVGHQQLSAYQDGVWFVSLAALTNPAAIAGAITAALGITMQGEPRTVLGQFLRQKHLLLILDNFEHLLGGSPEGVTLITELLQSAPQVQFLVTSRERLNVRGEQLYPVSALEYARGGSLKAALASPSVRLFVQSAQQAHPDFAVTGANIDTVLRICQLVEGIPLGLELAAANVGVLSLREIISELAQSAEILSAEWADLPARQSSMRTVFASSWQLLNETERQTLRQIAVFRGGFTRHAAQIVTGATLPSLTRLIHKSLLQWQESAEGSGRYAIHELLRQFAAEQLETAGERTVTEERHSRYYLQFVEERTARLARSEPKEASAEIQAELDNVRQAWMWAAHHRNLASFDQCAYAIWQFYTFSGLWVEGAQMFQLAAEAIGTLAQSTADDTLDAHRSQRLQSKLLAINSSFSIALSKHEQALVLAQQATQRGQATGSIEGETLGLLVQGQVLRRMGRTSEAHPLLKQAAHLARNGQQGDTFLEWLPEVETRAYGWLCSIALTQDDYAEARRYADLHRDVCQRLDKLHGKMAGLTDLVEIAKATGDFGTAQQYAEEAYQLAQQLDNRWGEASCQIELGDIMCALGHYVQAATLTRQSLHSYQQIGDPLGEMTTMLQLGRLYTWLGDYEAAQAWFDQYTRVLQAAGMPARETFLGLLALALHAHAIGNDERALALAEQGWQQAQQLDGRANQAYALTILGLAHERLRRLPEAANAYHQALAFYEALGHVHATVAPRAGLAQVALGQGDLVGALSQVEALLPVLAAHGGRPPQIGSNSAYFAHWIGYQVLAAQRDLRAANLLQQGYDLLQQDAARLDEESRQRFLTAIPIHHGLVAAYTEIQGDKESTSSPLSPSPPLPVSLPAVYDWDKMPTVHHFQGRNRELAALIGWVSDTRCRLVLILGIGGVGKSTLVAQTVRSVAGHFEGVIWSSLLNAPPPTEIVRQWLRVLTQPSGVIPPEDEEEQLRLLMDYLRRQRCLLVLDNAESILFSKTESEAGDAQPAGTLRTGYEGYAQLLQSLRADNHCSCLVMTSRELPHVLSNLTSQTPTVQMLSLTGLTAQDGQALLQAHGLASDDQTALALVNHYSGNPLALQIVSHTIVDLYDGDVQAFTAEGAPIFDDIRTVLDQQVARLSSLESELLLWLAIEREPISPVALRNNLLDKGSQRVFLEALRALQRRSLLEKVGDGFTLQNVIIEYLTDRLVEGVCAELLTTDRETGRGGEGETFSLSALNRHALLKVSANESVRQSQVRLILHPIAERLQAKVGKKRLVQQVQGWLDWLRAAEAPRQGYAAGNMLNLLLHLEVDLTGFDFSHLAVWRADLRGAYLPNLDFTGADLTGSMFTHRFGRPGILQFDTKNDLMFVDILGDRLRLWQLIDATLCQEVVLPDLPVFNVTMDGDCKTIVFLTSEHQLLLVDLTGQRPLLSLRAHAHTIWRYFFSPDSRWLISGDTSGLVCVWDGQSGQLVQARHITDQAITAVAMAPDGETTAAATVDGTIYLWSLTQDRPLQTLQGHTDEVATLSFAQNGNLLASGSHDTTVGVWDVKRGELRYRLHRHTQPIRHSFASTTGDTLVTGGPDPFVYVWDLERGVARHLLSSHSSGVELLALSPDGKRVAILDRNMVFSLWDAQQGQRIDSYPMYRNVISSVDFSRDGTMLLSGGGDGALYLWQMNGAAASHIMGRISAHKQRITAVAFNIDGQLLASGDDSHLVRLWDRASLGLRHTLDGHTGAIDGLAFSPDGRLLASISYDGTVILWSVANGQRLRTLTGHTNGVTRCAFSPVSDANSQTARQLLVTGSMDHTLIIWDAERGEMLQRLVGHTNGISGCVFSADGRRVISTSFDQTWCVWDTQTGQRLASGPTDPVAYIALTCHPTRPILAASGQDQIIRLLELETGQILSELHGHSEIIIGLRFHPDGQLLASASGDETIKLWDVTAALDRGGKSQALQTLKTPGPYAGMNITGVTGVSTAQKAALQALGAVEE